MTDRRRLDTPLDCSEPDIRGLERRVANTIKRLMTEPGREVSERALAAACDVSRALVTQWTDGTAPRPISVARVLTMPPAFIGAIASLLAQEVHCELRELPADLDEDDVAGLERNSRLARGGAEVVALHSEAMVDEVLDAGEAKRMLAVISRQRAELGALEAKCLRALERRSEPLPMRSRR